MPLPLEDGEWVIAVRTGSWFSRGFEDDFVDSEATPLLVDGDLTFVNPSGREIARFKDGFWVSYGFEEKDKPNIFSRLWTWITENVF